MMLDCIICKSSVRPQKESIINDSEDLLISMITNPVTGDENHCSLFRVYCSLLKLEPYYKNHFEGRFSTEQNAPLFCPQCFVQIKYLSTLYDELVSIQNNISKALLRTQVSILMSSSSVHSGKNIQEASTSKTGGGTQIIGPGAVSNSNNDIIATFRSLAVKGFSPQLILEKCKVLPKQRWDRSNKYPNTEEVHSQPEIIHLEDDTDDSLIADEELPPEEINDCLDNVTEWKEFSISNPFDNEDAATFEMEDPLNLSCVEVELSEEDPEVANYQPMSHSFELSNNKSSPREVQTSEEVIKRTNAINPNPTPFRRRKAKPTEIIPMIRQEDGKSFYGGIEILKSASNDQYQCGQCYKISNWLHNIKSHIREVHLGMSRYRTEEIPSRKRNHAIESWFENSNSVEIERDGPETFHYEVANDVDVRFVGKRKKINSFAGIEIFEGEKGKFQCGKCLKLFIRLHSVKGHIKEVHCGHPRQRGHQPNEIVQNEPISSSSSTHMIADNQDASIVMPKHFLFRLFN